MNELKHLRREQKRRKRDKMVVDNSGIRLIPEIIQKRAEKAKADLEKKNRKIKEDKQ